MWLEHRAKSGGAGEENKVGVPSCGNHGLQVKDLDFIPHTRSHCWGFKMVSTVARLASSQLTVTALSKRTKTEASMGIVVGD